VDSDGYPTCSLTFVPHRQLGHLAPAFPKKKKEKVSHAAAGLWESGTLGDTAPRRCRVRKGNATIPPGREREREGRALPPKLTARCLAESSAGVSYFRGRKDAQKIIRKGKRGKKRDSEEREMEEEEEEEEDAEVV